MGAMGQKMAVTEEEIEDVIAMVEAKSLSEGGSPAGGASTKSTKMRIGDIINAVSVPKHERKQQAIRARAESRISADSQKAQPPPPGANRVPPPNSGMVGLASPRVDRQPQI